MFVRFSRFGRFGRFGQFGRPTEPSAPTCERFGRLWGDFRFDLRNSENKANLLMLLWQLSQLKHSEFNLCCQAKDSSSCFSTENFVLTRMNLKHANLKNLCLIGHYVSIPAKSTVFRIW